MALNAPTNILAISLTQGSADAFVQSSILTGLTGRQAYNVRDIKIELASPAGIMAIAADFEVQVALTRRSKTAMPTYADNDTIYKWSFAVMLTTSGVTYIPCTHEWQPQVELPIVEDTIYAQVDSTGTGLSNVVVVRVESDLDTMSDIDRLNLITRSLS